MDRSQPAFRPGQPQESAEFASGGAGTRRGAWLEVSKSGTKALHLPMTWNHERAGKEMPTTMTQERAQERLHLPDLQVTGFRGIQDLSIARLGRVTLLAGQNGVGKTTILDAVRVFAARGSYSVLSDLLHRRDEFGIAVDDDGDKSPIPDISALFHGRYGLAQSLSIGPIGNTDRLTIQDHSLTDRQMSLVDKLLPSSVADGPLQAVRVAFGEAEQILPVFSLVQGSASKREYFKGRYGRQGAMLRAMGTDGPRGEIECVSLGPGLLQNYQIARFWDKTALTDEEYRAADALALVLGTGVERVAMIGDEERYRGRGRWPIVRLQGESLPVPLKSLGDGAVRLLGVALALANSRNGFLVIDEAENGIHHSVQRDFWRMVLETARKNDVQVLATTHSWDCVCGFAEAANENEEVEGVLARIEKRDGDMWAVEYSEDDLRVVAEQGIEVR